MSSVISLALWAAYKPRRLAATALELIEDERHELVFSAASIWEVTIKASLGRDDFDVDPRVFRRGLVESGYAELPITSAHAAAVADLPALHRDPFDRMLVAQARVEGLTLLTNDELVAAYGQPARLA
ncbi:MAG: type II toxin-antitoxin system VapC family toxin [Microbacterium sp.]|uniref:type II toxin-antitoxin system VapC family toxin n=1 Tax=Microbacterium sp. TaxID=51671 RepID=UPI0039E2385D